MTKIVEIIPKDLPDWAVKAMEEGQLFNVMLKKINKLRQTSATAYNDGYTEACSKIDPIITKMDANLKSIIRWCSIISATTFIMGTIIGLKLA